MNQLSAFQAQAASIALRKIFTGSHFSICDFDTLAKLLGVVVGGQDYDALRNLHCVHWSEMPKGMREVTQEKIIEMLGLPPVVMEMGKPDVKQQEPGRRMSFLQLIGVKP